MSIRVLGLYETRKGAAGAIERLLDEGYPRERIHLVTSAETHRREFATDEDQSSTGAAAGAAAGAAVGGLVTLAIVAAGAPVLAFAAAAAAAAGGTGIGWAIGSDRKPEEADLYKREVEAGRLLVTVETDDESSARRARDIFAETSALRHT